MDTEDLTKTVDNIYKNILEKFNPGARQLITAGKSYLKALHGAASATRIFNETLAKVAVNAQQSEITDIGSALLGIVGVYKEIQEQQMNILKAFYVDLLVPLETNLEKDTKVVQYEQKKFLQQHKVRMENYQKAVSTMKKQRKKKASSENTEKEIRNLQLLQEQKKKLDTFCEQSYKNAITQERRRYGFVLERQCSIAKHLMAYHTTGRMIIENNLDNWQKVAASREVIPPGAFESNGDMGLKALERMKNFDDFNGENISQLKKSCSVDAPYGDMRTLHETNNSYMQNSLSRAKSDFNIAVKKSSMELSDHGNWDQRLVVKALYAYMPSGENQLPFDEGDRIALIGGKANGWQFGENMRLKIFGWFPIAYTNAEGNVYAGNYRDIGSGDAKKLIEMMSGSDMKVSDHADRYESMQYNRNELISDYNEQMEADMQLERAMNDAEISNGYRQQQQAHGTEEVSPTRLFSDVNNMRNNKNKKYRASPNNNPRPGPPPTLPAPVPTVQNRILNLSRSFCTPNGPPPSLIEHRRKQKTQNGATNNDNSPHMLINHHVSESGAGKSNETTKTSLHSSNDSGFANEPPPQPAVDYSDEEQNSRVPIRSYHDKMRGKSPHEVASLTLNRSYRNSISSQNDDKTNETQFNGKTPYNLIASDDEILQNVNGGSIRRTKSFWKFRGKRGNDDILAGMALWQHRDLVIPTEPETVTETTETETATTTLTRQKQQKIQKTFIKNDNNNHNHHQRKHSFGSIILYDADDNIVEDADENIYGISTPRSARGDLNKMKIKEIQLQMELDAKEEEMSTLRRQNNKHTSNKNTNNNNKRKSTVNTPQKQQKQQQQLIYANADADDFESNATLKMNNKVKDYFDDMNASHMTTDSGVLLKTVKRKDILKQYYTSDTDVDVDEEESDKPEEDDDDDDVDDEDEEEEEVLDDDLVANDKDLDVETVKSEFDPYDCIVINDHLVRKDEANQRQLRAKTYHEQEIKFQTFRATMTKTQSLSLEKTPVNVRGERKIQQQQQQQQQPDEIVGYTKPSPARRSQNEHMGMTSPTATILPRTRLIKSTATTVVGARIPAGNMTTKSEKTEGQNNGREKLTNAHYSKSYGPWFDFWDLQKQEQYFNQSLNRQQKTAKNSNKN